MSGAYFTPKCILQEGNKACNMTIILSLQCNNVCDITAMAIYDNYLYCKTDVQFTV